MNDFDSKRWRQIEPLLDQALELSSAEVAAFLDRACAGDDGLRREVEALLRADASAGEFLERPAAELAPDLLIADDDGATDLNPLEGHRLGAWEIVREIGRGGMGAVYLARRADGEYRQIAALKLIKRGLDTDEILTRFRRERQILARLDHPQIARLLDGGATEGGLPYLVMEYVEGEPITAYCDRVRPSLETTLQLFIQVCLATEYAHRNLVIHRDLKPGNILVTSEGKVKLLDFGVARLLAGSEDEEDLETTAGQRRLTPNYAAPEQLRGEPSTTATDVYALGVVLYELLSGQRPYRRTGSPTEIERAVLEEIPMPPGAAAKNHGSRHAAWTDRIRGDLDNIVLAALKKDPAERYASATALREDVERFLTAIPVRATRPTWNYRAAKFIHRNRIAVTAAVLVGLSLLAGLVVSLWQVRVASHARDNAVVEARKASEIKGFVLDLFTSANPYQATDPDLTALQMVERGVTRVGQLRDQPEVQAEMLDVLGGVYREFDAFDRAESLVTAGYEIRRRLFGPHHPQVAQSLHHLGHIQFERGDYPAAESLMWESLSLRRALLPNDDDAVLTSMNDLAVILNRVDK